MTEYDRGRAAGLAEAVKVAEQHAKTSAWTDGVIEAKAIATALRALSTSPGEHVLVPREKTLAAEWLKQHWNTFCDADAIPIGRDRFIKELEDAGLVELREVVDEDLDEAFAFERGIEKGGMIWVLTEAARAMLSAKDE